MRAGLLAAEGALEVEEQRRVGSVAGVGRERLGLLDADPVEGLQQRRDPCLEHRVARLAGDRDGHLADRSEAPQEVELVAGQVVEAVDEDRPPPPVAAVVEQAHRVARDLVVVECGPSPSRTAA